MGLNVGKGGGVKGAFLDINPPPKFTLKKLKKRGAILGGKTKNDGCYWG